MNSPQPGAVGALALEMLMSGRFASLAAACLAVPAIAFSAGSASSGQSVQEQKAVCEYKGLECRKVCIHNYTSMFSPLHGNIQAKKECWYKCNAAQNNCISRIKIHIAPEAQEGAPQMETVQP